MNRPLVELLWLCILAALCAIMGILLIGGGILLFLAPRMTGIVWFGFCVLILLSLHQAYRFVQALRGNGDGKLRLYGLVFLFPLLLMLSTPPNASTPQQLPNTGLVLQQSEPTALQPAALQTPSPTAASLPTVTAQADEPEALEEQQPAPEPSREAQDMGDAQPCRLVDGVVPFDEKADRFADHMSTTNEQLRNKEITLYGFVYKEASFPEYTLLVGRLYISCCLADATVTGFHVLVDDTDAFEEGEWIAVTGTVGMVEIEFYGAYYDFPLLINGTVTRCTAPELEYKYIYP